MPARLSRSLCPLTLLLPLFAFLALAGLLCAPARAATLTVTNTGDSGAGSLRAQLAAAAAGDTITFGAGVTGTITLASALPTIAQSLTITGPGASTLALDGAGQYVGFNVTGGTVQSPVAISGLTIQNGSGSDGGGISNTGGGLTLTACTLSGNSATDGGGLYNQGTATLTDCTLSGNGAGVAGGGLYNQGTATLTDCTLSGNGGGGYGGGVYNGSGRLTLTNCTLSGNTASSGGGVNNAGTLVTLTACTFSGNSGGGLSSNSGTVTLTDDILYGDTVGEVGTGRGTVTASYCDVGETLGANGDGVTDGGHNLNATPKFVSATSPYDLHLQAGSPCLGAGTAAGAPTTDKDGVVRPNPPSIGAYELAQTGTTTTLTSSLNPSVSGQSVTFTATVAGAGGQPPTGSVQFSVDGTVAGTPVSLSGGSATYATTSLSVGPHTITAAYGGDGSNGASTSSALTQTVNASATTPVTHLLWSNPDGKAAFWNVMANGAATVAGSYGPFTDGAANTLWHATALASGPDGVSHLLWNNPDGKVALWSVTDGGGVTSVTGFGPYSDGPNLWSAAGISVGPDNVMHLLWTNPDHKAAFWDVTPGGSASVLAGYGPFFDGSSPWDAAGVSTGPDNVSHLLWHNADGKAAFWNVSDGDGSATALAGYGPFTDGAAGSLWSAAGISTGPDNVSHLLWDNADGKSAFWNVSDATGSATALAGSGPFFDGSSPWSATGLATGPDGVSRLLWNNPDGHAALWLLGASGSASSVSGFGPFTDESAQNLWSAVGISAGP